MDALLNLGNLDLKEGKINQAKDKFIKALKQSKTPSSDETINMALGNLNQQIGKFDEALENYQIINKINPNNTAADKAISTIHKYKNSDDPHFLSMKNKCNTVTDPNNLKTLYFALGKACEDFKNFKEAFKYLKLGNIIADKQIQYNIEDDNKLFIEIKRIFENINHTRKSNLLMKKLFFILGMPRSGTTLAEQIISSHRNVHGAGELNYMTEAVENFINYDKNFNLPLYKNFKNIKEISYKDFQKIQSEYSEKLNLHDFKEKLLQIKLL